MIHEPVSRGLAVFAECLAVGLACGDQRRLTGSGIALEALRDDALYKSTYFTFLLLLCVWCVLVVAPKLSRPPLSERVTEGESVEFDCRVIGTPFPVTTVSWTKSEQPLHVSLLSLSLSLSLSFFLLTL